MPDGLFRKAEATLSEAELLLREALHDGAISRAYYAMYHAARAVLCHIGMSDLADAKTHSMLIGAFSRHVVRENLVGLHLGRWLNVAGDLRLRADYGRGPFADAEIARESVSRASGFMAACHALMHGTMPGAAP